jgi:hypothetical protein
VRKKARSSVSRVLITHQKSNTNSNDRLKIIIFSETQIMKEMI